jgi:hypothetical protein
MSLLDDYILRAQREPPQGPVTRMTTAEIEEFLAEIRRGDQLLEQLLAGDDAHS